MSASTAYTPLEALLFFQYLSRVGVDPSSFSKISDLLKDNDFIRDAKTFDAGRLSPDSLRELYLNLLKEEIKTENEGASSDQQGVVGNQETQNPRKRKLPSPPLASVSDTARHTHLLPQLVTRLYVRYRQLAIQGIREDERRYDSLKRDIEEIECGKWDDRLERRQDTVSHEPSLTWPAGRAHDARGDISSFLTENPITPAPTSKKPLLGKDALTSSKEQQSDAPGPGVRNDSHRAGLGLLQSNQHGPSAGPDYTRSDFSPYNRAMPLATSSYSKPNDLYTVAQNTPRPPPHFGPVDGNLSYLPPPHQSTHGYRFGSASSDGHRSLPLPPPLQESSAASLRSPDAVHTSANASRASASPVILPPPPGMHRPPAPLTRPLDALADMTGQPYRPQAPSQPLRSSQVSPAQQAQGQPSQPRGYLQSPYQFPAWQPAYTGPYQTHTPQRLPNQYSPVSGPSALPPFQSFSPVQGQTAGQAQRHQAQQPQHRASLPAYVHNPGPSLPNVYNPSFTQSQKPANAGQQTTLSTPMDKRRLLQLSPLDTSGSSTKWKTLSLPGLIKSPGSPTPPGPEDVSPISERAPSPEQIPQPEKKLPKGRTDELIHQAETPEAVEQSLQETAASEKGNANKRGNRGRVSTPRGRGRGRGRGRAGSTTSSAIADSAAASTRSQSVLSHADELSMDTGTVKARKIKNEPPATPAGIVGDEDSEMAEPQPDESSRVSTRPRRGTLRGSETSVEITGTAKKRKRGSEPTPDDGTNADNQTMTLPLLNKSDYVLASRNFPRTSATIMNDVTAHKLASLFAKPLTDREAPGYKDLIYRPQDLKSIKSAISAGSRAVAAAADNTNTVGTPAGEAGSPGQGASTPLAASKNASLWIPKTADVVPPKGIVNSAQLEKELMRMFANAVMFNPDTTRGFGPAFQFKEGARGDDNDDRHGGARREREVGDTEGEDDDDGGGVVRDTREMFAAVEKSVAAWRAAERAAEEAGGGRAVVPVPVPVPVPAPVSAGPSRLRGGGEEKEKEKEKEKEEDEADELAGDEGVEDSGPGRERDDSDGQEQGQRAVKRRRKG